MNIAVLHPQCRVRGGAIKMALLTAQSLQKQGHKVMFYTFDHAPECFPELQEGLTLFTSATTKAPVIQNTEDKAQHEAKQSNQKHQITPLELSKSTVDTVDKVFTFGSIFRSLFPNISRSISLAWSIRQVDIVIAHNPPMQMVGALAKVFSFFSRYHQLLTVVWWHHHTPWYYVPNKKIQSTKYKILSLFSRIFWKSWFERRFVLPHIKYVIATSYYVAFCLEKYSGRKAIVVHPVITGGLIDVVPDERTIDLSRPVVLFTHGRLEPGKGLDTLVKAWKEIQTIQSTKYKIQSEGMVPVIPAKDEVREVESRGKETIPLKAKKGDDLDSVSEHGMTNIRLIIAGEGALAVWLAEQGATVIPYHDGLLEDIKKTENDTLAIYLSTIDAFGMASLEAQIAGLETIILDRGGARETVLLDSASQPMAQLVDTEEQIRTAITYFIQQRSLHKRVANVNFCHQRGYFSPSRLDVDIRSLIELMR